MRQPPRTTTETGGQAPPVFIQVWDIAVRVFHWGLVAGFAAAFLTAGAYGKLHTAIGYVVVSLILFRIVWGFAGTRHALFADFVRSPVAVVQYLRGLAAGRSPRHLGHNPAGGLMIVALLALFLVLGVTGPMMLTSAYFGNALIETLHHGAAYAILALLPLHLAGVVVASVSHRENLVAAMITGRKRAEGPIDAGELWRQEVSERMRAGNALAIAALVALLVFVLYPAAQAQIEVMQRRAAALAKAETSIGSVQPTSALTGASLAIAAGGRSAHVVARVGSETVQGTKALTGRTAMAATTDAPDRIRSEVAPRRMAALATRDASLGNAIARTRPSIGVPARRKATRTRERQVPPRAVQAPSRKPRQVGAIFAAPVVKPTAKSRRADRALFLRRDKSQSGRNRGSGSSGKGGGNNGKGSSNSGKGGGGSGKGGS